MNRLASLEKSPYDPRWFIWTIVFLIVSGVSLVSYIFITSSDDVNSPLFFPIKHSTVKTVTVPKTQIQAEKK